MLSQSETANALVHTISGQFNTQNENDKIAESEDNSTERILGPAKSLGVRRAELLMKEYDSIAYKIILFFSIFLVAYAYGLDGTIRYTFQAYATSSYSEHSLLSTINVIRSVIAAAAQPAFARASDVFGRLELLAISILFYVVGTVIESQAYDIQRFCGGAIMYQIGYTGVMLILQVLLADCSNLNWRLAASFIPALPFIINTWISGDVTAAVGLNWSWGIGMWAFIFPLLCIPLLVCMLHMRWKAGKTEEWRQMKTEATLYQELGFWKFSIEIFHRLDVIGLLFIVVILGLILVPFTLAGGVSTTWQQAKIIAPLVIGIICIPFFVVWEHRLAKHPLAPMHLLKDRGVWAALIIAIFINFIWYMQGDFMYTILIVAVNESIKSATRMTSLYSFVSVITGTILGFVVAYFKRVKHFIVFGVSMWFVAMGILLHFRGDSSSHSGIIGGLCLLGFGAGFFTYSTQVSIQSCTDHEHMAVVIALYLTSYNFGSAFGNSVSGAIWTQKLYPEMVKKLGDAKLATYAYSSPYDFIVDYAWDTTERMAVVAAYRYVQRLLITVGLCLCVPLLAAALLLRDYKLESVQSLKHDEEETIEEKGFVSKFLK
ncbi:hypothetical protein BABINDRAFT_178632 [Babjeviella inositovora NRRL Y-12698]|uniref:Major facilitator superfamily (MFS) profile domain-containing protein n=1 Tax=Babjeviella inositovora NRRL Y-12698 TaxID=984486 RepID=A0A1E3QX62_9ASCO|nr:uncharacterized protein BABINDRAFT_178632 [Babjeviella inositovora NRRL Y-12698]ODQ82275.1 hypothetical protein BABINDRAFT_178632 [Babjeviella inositovora NRRL Y-12698]